MTESEPIRVELGARSYAIHVGRGNLPTVGARARAASNGSHVALVTNPKTPLQISLKLLPGLNDREVRVLAKSRNVSSVIQAQARRMILRKGP